jgi:hypothetical protein
MKNSHIIIKSRLTHVILLHLKINIFLFFKSQMNVHWNVIE